MPPQKSRRISAAGAADACVEALYVGAVLIIILVLALIAVQVRAYPSPIPRARISPRTQWADLWSAHHTEALSRRLEYVRLTESHLCTDSAAMSMVDGAAEVCRDARNALRESDTISSAWDASRALWVRKLRPGLRLSIVGACVVTLLGTLMCCGRRARRPAEECEWTKHA